jgi:hypothetical protein
MFYLIFRTDYKQVLLQIERLYSVLLEVEALKLKLSAIPTGAPLREQVWFSLIPVALITMIWLSWDPG